MKRKPYKPKSREEIHRNMAAIASTENKTETALRKSLFALGLRYRKYTPLTPGRPDIVFPREKVVVFVDGDYWHGRTLRERGIRVARKRFTEKQREYWLQKLARNVARDSYITNILESRGWLVLRFWESDVKRDIIAARDTVAALVAARRKKFF